MDNIETIETKKKMSILDIVEITVLFLFLAVMVLFRITKREFILFGYLFNEHILSCVWLILSGISMFSGIKWNKTQKILFIVCCVLTVFVIVLCASMCYYDIQDTVDTEQITLSDGNEIFLRERIDYIAETTYKLTYIDVYQINGFAAKNLGKIDETYFSNKCLLQDKYSYEYDEASKKLTIICEYGTYGENSAARLSEEYDTGFWKEEFILK